MIRIYESSMIGFFEIVFFLGGKGDQKVNQKVTAAAKFCFKSLSALDPDVFSDSKKWF